mgnify:CR=1 FL=1
MAAQNNVVEIILRARDLASGIVTKVQKSVSGLGGTFNKLAGASEKVAFIGIAFQNLLGIVETVRGALSGVYDLFIGQNVELQEQLLSTQASLAATNDVLQGGIKIDDPTQAIQALEGPVRDTLEKIRQDSLELVGVTSSQLVPIFQILAQESSGIGASLEDAGDLTIDFAAALGTLGIPLDFARQEIASILQGQINSDSQLAKSIGLNNEQVKLWKEQGTLVENLRGRLEAFRAGNALAAQTIGGISSNILEIFQEVARISGEPLLAPIVEELEKFYGFLEANRDRIQNFIGGTIDALIQISEPIRKSTNELGASLLRLADIIINNYGEELKSLGISIGAALGASTKATIDLVTRLIDTLSAIADSPVFQAIVARVSQVISVVGEGLGNAFGNLQGRLGDARDRLEPVGQAFGFIFEQVKRLGPLVEASQQAWGLLFDVIRIGAGQLNNGFQALQSLVAFFSGPFRGLIDLAQGAAPQAFQVLGAVITTVVGAILGILERLSSAIINARQTLRDLGLIREELEPALQGTSDAMGGLEQAFEDFSGQAGTTASDIELVGDPLRALERDVQQASKAIENNKLDIDVDQSKQFADLQEQLAQGLINESEFQKKRREITRAGLQDQLAVVNEQVAKLKEAYNALDPEQQAQAAEQLREIQKLEKQSADIRTQIAEDQAKQQQETIEKAQKEALDAIKAAETERQIELQKLRNQGLISAEEEAVELSKITQERIQGELEAEQVKLEQIKATQGENSSAARESQQRILDLTKQALEEEKRLYDAQTALIRKQLESRAQAYKNELEAQNQVLEDQLQLFNSLASALDNQNRLLQAGQNLQNAQLDGLTSSLDIVASLETSEIRRRQLQQTAAAARLEGLREAQRIENEMARIQQVQNALALERRAIENEIAIARQQAEIAQQEVEVQLAQRELQAGNISQAEFDAQVLALQAQQQALTGLQRESGLIQQEQAIQPLLDQLADATRAQQQETAVNQARAQIVETAAPADRRRLRQQLEQDLLGSDSRSFLQQNRGGLQDFINNEFSGRGPGQGLLNQLDPGRASSDDLISQFRAVTASAPGAAVASPDLAPQFAPLTNGIAQLQPLQSEANGILAKIAENTARGGSGGGTALPPINLQVTVEGGGNAQEIADAVSSGVSGRIRAIAEQAQQLGSENN